MRGSLRGGPVGAPRQGEKTMKRMLWAAGIAATLGMTATHAAEPSLCAQLADKARQLPAAAWAGPEPLGRWLQWVDGRKRPGRSRTETALANDPRWRERLSGTADGNVAVRQLPDTPVLLLESFGGTANCQSVALVEVRPGQAVRELPPPFQLAEQNLCVTRYARLARVFDHPALVVGGAQEMSGSSYAYRIAAWQDAGWAPSCSLELKLRQTMTPAQHFCAPGASVCQAGQAVAQQLALAYDADRRLKLRLDEARFADGHAPDVAVRSALDAPLTDEGAVGDFNLPLPVFGADRRTLDPMKTQFSNADPRRLSVFIEGRWWLAVVGRAGVGWREGDAVLVALFAPPGRPGDAVASYQFVTGPAGLKGAVARDEKP